MRIFKQAFEQLGSKRDKSNDKNLNRSAETFRYKSPDSLFQQPQKKASPSLSRQFFTLLSTMEQKFVNSPTNELINNLVSMYQQCVELYDTLQDPIKYYFVEKIQNVLAEFQTKKQRISQSGLKQLPLQNQTSTLTIESSNNSLEEFHDVNDTELESKDKQQPIIVQDFPLVKEQKETVYISQDWYQQMQPENEEEFVRQNQRAKSRKISIRKQIQEGEEQQQNQLKFLLNDYQTQTISNEKLIRASLDNQEKFLQDRLRKRSESGIKRQLTHSMTSKASIVQTSRDKSSKYDEFL